MTDLFDDHTPIRAVIHVNLHRQRLIFDWDIAVTNPETGDVLAMKAVVARRRESLGVELARMLLEVLSHFDGSEHPDPAE